MCGFVMFNDLRSKVNDDFVDKGGIIDSLFHNLKSNLKYFDGYLKCIPQLLMLSIEGYERIWK